jgi:hypothetical protein
MNSSEIEVVVTGADEEKIETLLDKLIDKVGEHQQLFLRVVYFFKRKLLSILSIPAWKLVQFIESHDNGPMDGLVEQSVRESEDAFADPAKMSSSSSYSDP